MSDREILSSHWYSDLCRDELVERLHVAERALLLFGWTAYRAETDREKALHELWSEWQDLVPDAFVDPKSHPDLSDKAIAPLARCRDATVAATLAKITEMRAA
jgi:hypothetical protein